MHVTLTDVLTCPRCGPDYGLVLIPESMRDRRVVAGTLGCPNCRERYRVEDGVAQLGGRAPSPEEAGAERARGPAGGREMRGDMATRVAGLLGLGDARGPVWVMGSAVAVAEELAALVPDVEVVVAGRRAAGGTVSTLSVGDPLPFRSTSLSGVALTGGAGAWLEEGARVVGPGARLLLDPAPEGARERVEAAGLRVLAQEGDTLLATR